MNDIKVTLTGDYTQADLLKLLQHDSFRTGFCKDLGDDAAMVIALIEANEPIPDDVVDVVFDAIGNNFGGEISLTLGWDSDGPGGSGAVYINGYEAGPFRLSSSDFPEEGPFGTLEEALGADALSEANWNAPEVWSDQLSLEKLLEIAKQIMLFEEGEGVRVNDEEYVVRAGTLVQRKDD